MSLKRATVAMYVLLGALLTGVFPAGAEHGGAAEIVVQVSLTAGLRYHDAKAVWDRMKEGEPLALVREPENPYDMNAVRVDWNGHPLGYIPRTENAAIARQMDHGNKLQARITKLTRYRNNHRKLEFEVFLPL
jgi:hypothetical protein